MARNGSKNISLEQATIILILTAVFTHREVADLMDITKNTVSRTAVLKSRNARKAFEFLKELGSYLEYANKRRNF